MAQQRLGGHDSVTRLCVTAAILWYCSILGSVDVALVVSI